MEEENNNRFTTSFVSLAPVTYAGKDIPVAAAIHPGEPFGNDAKLDQAIKEAKNRKCLYKTGIVSAAQYSAARVRLRLIENDRFRSQFPHAEQPHWAAQMQLTMARMEQNMNDRFAQMEGRFAQMEGRDGMEGPRFIQMDQRMASSPIAFFNMNMKHRTKNAFFFQQGTTQEPLLGIAKEISGVGPGLPNHPVLAVPNPVAVGQIPPGFPADRIAFDSLSHAELSDLSAQYNHTFGIVATDDLGSCRDKFKVFITGGYYLEQKYDWHGIWGKLINGVDTAAIPPIEPIPTH
jgi:hypothetical protein